MASIAQYLRETRAELRHVAWPTQLQTIVYTLLVAFISLFIALYLGLFDYIFTTGLTGVVNTLPQANQNPITVTNVSTSSLPESTTTQTQ